MPKRAAHILSDFTSAGKTIDDNQESHERV